MDALAALLEELNSSEIRLYEHEGSLRVRDPHKRLTDRHREQIRAWKPRLLEELRTAAPVSIPKLANDKAAPLSFAQERLWFLDRLAPGKGFYNMPVLLRLNGDLDIAALNQSIEYLLARHESLRTVVATERVGDVEQPRQEIQPQTDVDLQPVDVSGEGELLRLTMEEGSAPFDLVHGPLMRVKLYRLGARAHVVQLTLHHIVCDGWSLGVLVRDLGYAYWRLATGSTPSLPRLPIQYKDYAAWQRDHLAGRSIDKQLAYWRNQLADAPAFLDLPADRPRPAEQSFRGSHFAFRIEPHLTSELKRLAREHEATLFMVLLSGFSVLLSRYSRQSDIVIGAPIANRPVVETEPLIGVFANTLALRARLDSDLSFRSLLGQLRRTSLDAYEHKELAFERVVEELAIERSLSHNPLFQVMLALENSALEPITWPGLTVVREPAALPFSRVDLSLTFAETEGAIAGIAEYSTDLFDEDRIARLIGHLIALLESAAADPAVPVARLAMLTPEERQQLVQAACGPAVNFGPARPIHLLFEEQAGLRPGALAVSNGSESLTYAELNGRANRIAHHLIGLGVKAGMFVAIALSSSIDLMVATLAALKSGAAYVPIDPDYPAARIRYILEDSGAAILLANRHQELEAAVARTVLVDAIENGELAAGNPGVPVDASNLAYAIYTSGSTGLPKGVLVQHEQLFNLIRWQQRLLSITERDRASQIASPAFDAAVFETFPYLTAGAAVVFGDGNQRLEPDKLPAWLSKHGVTIAFLPTPILEAMWEAEEHPRVRIVMTGGDKLNRCAPDGAPYRLINNYGPTENTVVATSGAVKKTGERGEAPSIGRPIDNVRAYILDGALQPVPLGIPGELYLAGAQVARGYWNRPELTAERFIELPEYGRVYRTGDLCRWRKDWEIEFLGRIDRQVKIRGFRIEPGEIEAALLSQPGVNEAVVLARDGRLAACYAGGADPQTVERALAARLPAYMIPRAFMRLDSLPRNPNGKIDRRALEPAPVESASVEYAEPRGILERQVAAIWKEVLRVERIGLGDHFFALGGHSLLATRVISKLRGRLGIDAPLKTLFEAPELRAFIEKIRGLDRSGLDGGIVPVPRHDPAHALSFAQRRIWFLDQLEPGLALYNIPIAIRLTGRLHFAALERSFSLVIARHESLRTTFDRSAAGDPFQVVHPPFAFHLESAVVVDEEEARGMARAESMAPFDLRAGPLVRAKLIETGPERRLLLITQHHIVSDGWSTGVFLRELAESYRCFAAGREPALDPLPIQYVDFAVWQRNHLTPDLIERHVAYWRQCLDGAPALLELPTDRPRPQVQSHHGSHHAFVIDASITAKLEQLAARYDATLFMALLSAFAILLARYSRSDDVVIGTPVANRDRVETEGLIGLFVNMLPLRIQMQPDLSFPELLQRVRDTATHAFEHREFPFDQLIEAISPERNLSHTPLFQAVFVLQNLEIDGFELPGLQGSVEPSEYAYAKFDLTLNLRPGAGCYHGILEYNTGLFDAGTIVRMAGHFVALVTRIAEGTTGAALAIPMLDGDERRQLLTEWSSPTRSMAENLGPPATIHAMFERQAQLAQQSPALTLEGETVTYADLNARANRLAHHLIELGVKPDTLVAVAADRSADMVAGLLAILKAGGAYVPVDPSYPPDRIAFILGDCEAKLLLTSTHLANVLPRTGARLVFIGDQDVARYPDTNPCAGATDANLAYVIYTSGSTGQPKGALITHRNVWRLLAATEPWFGFSPADVWTFFHSFAFDFSVWEMWGALCYGGRLVIVPYHVSRDPRSFYRLVCEEGVTVLNQTPSAFRQFSAVACEERSPDSLRYVIFGGEALEFESLRPWFEFRGNNGPAMINMYGITETTVHVTYQPVRPRDLDQRRGSSRIGQPIGDLSLFILEPSGEPAPVGVPGELHVAGEGLARGYLNRPGLTAERFINRSDLGRLYKTGDLCRWLPDGNIEYLGRTDLQVKVRGFRVELGEIESALLQQPGVREATVLVREDRPGDKRIVAYLVGEGAAESIRRGVLEKLPEYMAPTAFVWLDRMPLTPNGKLDRRSLPAPASAATATESAPGTAIEMKIAEIWTKALGIASVGWNDNFFDIGGHSLLAVKVRDEIQALVGRPVAIVDLFRHPTVRQLAHFLGGHEEDSNGMADAERGRAHRQKQAFAARRARAKSV